MRVASYVCAPWILLMHEYYFYYSSFTLFDHLLQHLHEHTMIGVQESVVFLLRKYITNYEIEQKMALRCVYETH